MNNLLAIIIVVAVGLAVSFILGVPIVEVVAIVAFAAGVSAAIALGDQAVNLIAVFFS